MMCGGCRSALEALAPRARAGWRYEPLLDAIVWDDERAPGLCAGCERLYGVVLNVRTQHLMGESPSAEFLSMYERFRQALPGWVGSRRTKLSREQRRACRGPLDSDRRTDEIVDED